MGRLLPVGAPMECDFNRRSLHGHGGGGGPSGAGGGGGSGGGGGARTGTVIGGSPGISTTVDPTPGGIPGNGGGGGGPPGVGAAGGGGGGGGGATPLLTVSVTMIPGTT